MDDEWAVGFMNAGEENQHAISYNLMAKVSE
jgi:hypothetical protein